MPTTPKGPLAKRAGVGLAVAAAIIGGTLLAKDQLTGGAAGVGTLSDRNGTLQGLVHTGPIKKGHPFVPFLGPFAIHPGKGQHQCGPAVRLLEGALKRKHIRKDKPRNCIGIATKRQIQAFQRSVGYKPTGVYTLVVHQRMVKANGYTNEARRDLLYLAHKAVVTRERHNVQVVAAHVALVGGSTLAYCQSGSRSYFPAWPRVPPCTDCSGMATFIAYQSGFGAAIAYFGAGSVVGWTGSLSQQGVSVGRNQTLQPGDFVFYPSSSARGRPWGHVAVYIGRGLVISHGSVGVKILPYAYRAVGEIRRYTG